MASQSAACAKCGGPVDTGSVSHDEGIRYISDRQTGVFRRPTLTRRAVVCRTCGFMELYVDPEELARDIGE